MFFFLLYRLKINWFSFFICLFLVIRFAWSSRRWRPATRRSTAWRRCATATSSSDAATSASRRWRPTSTSGRPSTASTSTSASASISNRRWPSSKSSDPSVDSLLPWHHRNRYHLWSFGGISTVLNYIRSTLKEKWIPKWAIWKISWYFQWLPKST